MTRYVKVFVAIAAALILFISCKRPVETTQLIVNTDDCTGCGKCVEVCPYNAIEVIDGSDFNDHDIADRLTSRIRMVQMVIPSVSVNATFESVLDFDDGITRSACTSAESRVIYRFMKNREIPSAVVISGKLSRSSIRTERAGIFSRINLFKGLSLLIDAEARVTPTSVAGAGPDRKRYIFGPGLEYQLGTAARVWGIVEQERTNLAKNENWWRLRAGLEFYPNSFNI